MVTYRGREATPIQLSDNEELDTTKLNDAKNALGDLKIVDVRRKPAGLGTNLRADESFTGNLQNQQDLQTKGFYTNSTEDGGHELLCANGEIHVLMKDGYRYLLRFGSVEGTDDESEEGGLNRYLFVTASVDESKFPEPELEDLPSDDSAAAGDEGEAAKEETGEADDADEETDGEAAEAQPEADDGDAEDARKRVLAAERERITKDNQRKLDEWNDKKEKAETKVNELDVVVLDHAHDVGDAFGHQ